MRDLFQVILDDLSMFSDHTVVIQVFSNVSQVGRIASVEQEVRIRYQSSSSKGGSISRPISCGVSSGSSPLRSSPIAVESLTINHELRFSQTSSPQVSRAGIQLLQRSLQSDVGSHQTLDFVRVVWIVQKRYKG